MATSVTYRCGGCKKRMTREIATLFYPLGVPYIQCPHCGSLNLRSASVNEWDLMTLDLKARCFVELTLFGVFFGGAAGSAVSGIAKDQLGFPQPSSFWFAFWPLLGVLLGIVVMSQWLKARIRKSRERLANDDYAATLVRLGIASGATHRLTAGPANSAGTNYYDRPVSEVGRDYALRLHDLYAQHRDKLPKWSGRTWTLVSISLVVVMYASAFAVQSVRAEKYCLRDQRAASFYVSPWTLSRYCTSQVAGREYTFDASEH
jgi:hypothetical protein